MRPLAESATHPCRQLDTGFTELVPQTIGRCKSILPPLLTTTFKQINLIRLTRE